MAKSLEKEAGEEGAKVIWAAANPDETSIYVMMDVPNPEFMQTFGLREDVKKAVKKQALMSQRPQLLRQSVITGWVNAYFSCPSQRAKAPVMAPVT